jgi:hypothetical protein
MLFRVARRTLYTYLYIGDFSTFRGDNVTNLPEKCRFLPIFCRFLSIKDGRIKTNYTTISQEKNTTTRELLALHRGIIAAFWQ